MSSAPTVRSTSSSHLALLSPYGFTNLLTSREVQELSSRVSCATGGLSPRDAHPPAQHPSVLPVSAYK